MLALKYLIITLVNPCYEAYAEMMIESESNTVATIIEYYTSWKKHIEYAPECKMNGRLKDCSGVSDRPHKMQYLNLCNCLRRISDYLRFMP